MHYYLYLQAGSILIVIGAFLLLRYTNALKFLNDVLSAVINRYLLWRYPIRHVDGDRLLPTCPYRFPDGQGDVGKFLQGMKNSERWEKQNGSVYRIWSGTRAEIVLTRPEHLQAVFKDSDKHSKAVNNNSGFLMSQLLGNCLGLISGEDWRALRIAMEQPFLRSVALDYIPMIHKHLGRHFDELYQIRSLSQGLLDPAEDLKLLPFWVVAEVFYGELSPEMVSELRSLASTRESLFSYVIRGGVTRFGISKYLPIKANKLLDEFQSRWAVFNDVALQHAKTCNSGAPIIRLYELVDNGTISRKALLHTLDESLYANLDVTTGGISWNIAFLAAYKNYQDLLRQELAMADESRGGRDRYLQSSSTLLAACIAESSRLKPLAAFSVPQSAPTTRVVEGYAIPPGTDFIVDSYALNIRNEYWGSDASTYRPERFFEKGNTELRYHFWRFGFGPRQCMGRYVADLTIRALMVHLVENYDLALLIQDGRGTEGGFARNPETWINHPKMQIRCERRNTHKPT